METTEPRPRDLGTPDAPAVTADPEQVRSRAELSPEERRAGSDDPIAQAATILDESEERTAEVVEAAGRARRPDGVERRTSEETVDTTD